jgi:hypothetical protein
MQQWGQTPEDGKGESTVVIRALAHFHYHRFCVDEMDKMDYDRD